MKGIAVWVRDRPRKDSVGRRAPDSFSYRLSGIDLMARGMEPRPLFSERRRMERLSPTGLGAYLLLRAVYFAIPDRVARTRLVRHLWRSL